MFALAAPSGVASSLESDEADRFRLAARAYTIASATTQTVRARSYRKACFNRFVVFCNCRFMTSTCLAISSSSSLATNPALAT